MSAVVTPAGATVRTGGEDLTGRTVEGVIRTRYGRDAYLDWSADRNTPEVGQVVRRDQYGTHVLARVLEVSGPLYRDDYATQREWLRRHPIGRVRDAAGRDRWVAAAVHVWSYGQDSDIIGHALAISETRAELIDNMRAVAAGGAR